jgi:hypothetical protein
VVRIERFEAYLEKVFELSRRVEALGDRRCSPRVELAQVFAGLFWGTVLRRHSLHRIEAECREGVLAGRIGPLSESTVGYALERLELDSLRQLSYAVARQLKRDQMLNWETAGGRLVMALDGIEVFRSEHRCCSECLIRRKQRREREVVEFHHRVVVASLVGFGFRSVVDLENQRAGENELGAAERLLRRLRLQLGARFFQIVTVDALYANAAFLQLVQQLGWDMVTVLKDNQPDLQCQAECLLDRPADQQWERDPRTSYQIWEEEALWWDVARDWIRLVQVHKQQWVNEQIGTQKRRRLRSTRQTYLTTCAPRQITARSILRLGEVRWELETSTFSHATTDYALKHAQVHAGKPKAFLAQLWIRLLAISLFMIYVQRQVWSHMPGPLVEALLRPASLSCPQLRPSYPSAVQDCLHYPKIPPLFHLYQECAPFFRFPHPLQTPAPHPFSPILPPV